MTSNSQESVERRISVLEKLDLLEIDETESFDRLTHIVSELVNAPVSLATMVTDNHQWFLGCTGIKEP